MKNTNKTLSNVIDKLLTFSPDKLVALKRGDDSPYWIGRAKFVYGAVTAQAMCETVLAVESEEKLTTIILP